MKNKHLRLILLASLVLVLALCITACTPEQNDTGTNDIAQPPQNIATTPENQDTSDSTNEDSPAESTLSGTLTISQCWDLLRLDVAVERFAEIHPNVEIVLNRFNNDWQRYNAQVSAQLLAGVADDIIDAAMFPFLDFADRGFLVDIYPLMRNDPDFNEDDYFMNVIYGMKHSGTLFAFPSSFTYVVVGVNNLFDDELVEIFRQYETISFRQILDLYFSLPYNGGRFVGLNMDVLNIITESFREFIDRENNIAHFNTDEFIKFISDARDGTNPQKAIDGLLGGFIFGNTIANATFVENAYNYLFFSTPVNAQQVFFPHVEEVFTHFIPLATNSGEIMTQSSHQFLINAASENIELAWEFLKFLTTDEVMNSNAAGNIPINREMVEISIHSTTANIVNVLLHQEMAVIGSVADISEHVLSTLGKFNEMPMQDNTNIHDRSLLEMITDITTEFYYGFLSAEQTATELQNRVTLYLMERG
jgi:multiple sugar transport system substrate-binding protein